MPESGPPGTASGVRGDLLAYAEALRAVLERGDGASPARVASVRRLAKALSSASAGCLDGLSRVAAEVAALDDEAALDGGRRLHERVLGEIAAGARPPATILIVTDEASVPAWTGWMSSFGRELVFAATPSEAETATLTPGAEVVIVDRPLRAGDGLDVVARLRARPESSHLPLVVVARDADAHTQAEAFALGADAFFGKPVDPVALSAATSALLARAERVRSRTVLDPLTGLSSREAFLRSLAEVQSHLGRSGERVSLAVLDLDAFSALNAAHGRGHGDDVLVAASRALRLGLRHSDLLARWGADAFAVALRGSDPRSAEATLGKVRGALEGALLTVGDGIIQRITFSAGVAEIEVGDSIEEAIQKAEARLARAAAAGGNRVIVEDDPTPGP